jgi:hypothetical protein
MKRIGHILNLTTLAAIGLSSGPLFAHSGAWDPEVKKFNEVSRLAIALIRAATVTGCSAQNLRQDLYDLKQIAGPSEHIHIELNQLTPEERSCLKAAQEIR